jgi:hypothetical protein
VIDFELSEEHIALEKTVREFCQAKSRRLSKNGMRKLILNAAFSTKWLSSDFWAFAFPSSTAARDLITFLWESSAKNSKRAILFARGDERSRRLEFVESF